MAEQLELEPQNTIRIETALSRFPVHKLARQRGGILIDIKETTPTGEIKTKWEVTYNSKYGQPGPLAYKLDTLIINRRIDEARPSIPKVIKLGSLHEICRELGVSEGKSKNDVKRALRQNAFAGITAKIIYRATNGIEQTLEADFTRYSIIFTGERFPDGRRANAVYIILNDIYLKVVNEAQTRPLDYDYLRELSPAAQRFYELIGFQIYAVLKHERPRARLSYADFCTRAPQTRYLDWEHVRKQMYKVHAPHLRSGYLAGVEFQEQQTASGEPDWLMLYTPGRRALAEFKEANRKLRAIQRPSVTPRALLPTTAEPQQSARQFDISPAPAQIGEADDAGEQLVSRLMSFHVAEATARELVRDYRKSVELQLRALPHRNIGKIKDLASWLIKAIQENYELPEAMKAALEKEEEIKRRLAKHEAEQTRQRRREALQPAYYDFLREREGEHRGERQEAYSAFLTAETEQRAEIESNRIFKPRFKKHQLEIFDHPESHLDRLRVYFNEPTLDEWLEQNPDPS
jgi:DNA-binding Lrp family transcriptional regulator